MSGAINDSDMLVCSSTAGDLSMLSSVGRIFATFVVSMLGEITGWSSSPQQSGLIVTVGVMSPATTSR